MPTAPASIAMWRVLNKGLSLDRVGEKRRLSIAVVKKSRARGTDRSLREEALLGTTGVMSEAKKLRGAGGHTV